MPWQRRTPLRPMTSLPACRRTILGDKAFAANRGGDSRSLVIVDGDTAWLLHMDSVPAEAGFPQLGAIARSMLDTCPCAVPGTVAARQHPESAHVPPPLQPLTILARWGNGRRTPLDTP
jgi:hypothetical protein